jgi:DHA1 family bicyclomycin/chloramphenicol resistance-like MFS transporter
MTALSIDMMLPSLDQLRADLAVLGANDQQLVVTAYLIGFAFGQLFYGPLSDRFGRRPVLFGGLAVGAAAAFWAVAADSLGMLLAARLVQGAALAAPRVVAMAVVRDVYGGRRMAEVMSFVMMVFIIVPVIAPSVGSLLMLVGGWRAIFGFLGFVSLALLIWTVARLPETRTVAMREPLSLTWLGAAIAETVTTRQTLGYSLAVGCLLGSLMSYVTSAQQIFVEVYHLGDLFPLAFGVVAIGMAAASLLNSRIVVRVGMRRVSHTALLGFCVAGLGLAGVAQAMTPPPLALYICLLGLALFCFGLIMPNFNALAMEPMGRIAGTASSIIGALTTALGAVLGAWVGQHFDGTVGPLSNGFAIFAAAGLVIVLATERGRLFRAAPA